MEVEAGCLNLRIQITLFEVEIEEKAKKKKGESMKIFSHRVFPQTHATACLTGETY